MKHLKRVGFGIALAFLYVALPFAIFDFSVVAVPRSEEFFDNQSVAIGPLPRSWVPFAAADFDIPGGYGYEADGWAFVVWKPLCIWFAKKNGYAAPAEWR